MSRPHRQATSLQSASQMFPWQRIPKPPRPRPGLPDGESNRKMDKGPKCLSYCWCFRNPAFTSWGLVVYPPSFRGFLWPSQVVQDCFHQQYHYLASLCDLFGMIEWPFQRLSDLQPGDKMVTFNHLVQVSLQEDELKSLTVISLFETYTFAPPA